MNENNTNLGPLDVTLLRPAKPHRREEKKKPAARPASLIAPNIGLLLDNAEEILDEPRWYWSIAREALWHRIFATPEMVLPIGLLLEMWGEGMMTVGEGDDRVLVYASAGSPLSGSGWFKGVKPPTGEVITGRTRGDEQFDDNITGVLTSDCIHARKELERKVEVMIEGVELADLIETLETMGPS
jgi:hypothetical protein